MAKDAKPKSGWKQDPAAVRADILRIATEMFARTGLSGTRIDEIAARTKTSKRMIYYYFGDKTGLYAQALEAAYAKVREGERQLELEGLAPDEALARLVGFTFDHHRRNADFIRLVMIENVHNAAYVRNSSVIKSLNEEAIARLRALIARGEADGLFRKGLDPVALHWKISAFSVFNVSNQPTFSSLYGDDIFSESGQSDLRESVVAMILRYVERS
ncbi:TetR/AcrR family transcriptional regulator [Salipiger sp. IMCC34102]|uniref:TetR/AcrR family transcriptional regulator n=1 Tax=Salipiger sp. IMCC34102 TaxID=2510647 RepID=UPI00101BA668|nr:TetR/AcrR family transcriptional regulator [Salipiger sp. IMCC34102]RYH04439.1 TetR/AcrR family transcriptional regulator [Salipiger sp. IMCC34102]